MRQKGLIMKVSNNNAVVMTADRQFISIPAEKGMSIGQEVAVSIQIPFNTRRRSKFAFLATAAAVVLTVSLWQWPGTQSHAMASAYVAIDINPSIELAVDHQKDVLSVTALNEDGKKVLGLVTIVNLPVDQAVDVVTKKAVELGYIKQDSDIIITTSKADASESSIDLPQLETTLLSVVNQTIQTNGLHAQVAGVIVSDKIRTEAKAAGLSQGKYAVYLQAKVKGVPVKVDDFKNDSVTQVVTTHSEIDKIVSKMDGKMNLDELLADLQRQTEVVIPNNNHDNGQDNGNNDHDQDGNGKGGDKKLNPDAPNPPVVPGLFDPGKKGTPATSVPGGNNKDKGKDKGKNNDKKDGDQPVQSPTFPFYPAQKGIPALTVPNDSISNSEDNTNSDDQAQPFKIKRKSFQHRYPVLLAH